jgi:hypothetical protein
MAYRYLPSDMLVILPLFVSLLELERAKLIRKNRKTQRRHGRKPTKAIGRLCKGTRTHKDIVENARRKDK